MFRRWIAGFGALIAAATAASHPAPNSSLRLEVLADAVRAEYWLPVSELGYARAREPRTDLQTYLVRRMSAETPVGTSWRIYVKGIRGDRYLDHEYLVADLLLTPPRGQPVNRFVLTDDVITHEVRNHRLFVVQRPASGAQPAARLIGTLQYPARRLEIALNE
jgi:hypothetical protein